MSAPVIEVRDLSFGHGETPLFDGLNLRLEKGEVLAIVGRSGCGKTTLLDLICGHRAPWQGTVTRNGRTLRVYQKDGLLPWLTVRENVWMGAPQGSSGEEMVRSLLELTGLSEHGDKYPSQISGGMRQKTELARVLAAGAEALLLDEPWSSLDYGSRMKLRAETFRILASRRPGVLLVTHDLDEAALLADRILVLEGRPAKFVDTISIRQTRPRRLVDGEVSAVIEQLHGKLGIT